MKMQLTSGDYLFKKKRSKYTTFLMTLFVVVFVCISFFYLFFGLTLVDGISMENTIFDGQKVFFQKSAIKIERGDIVTLNVGTRKNPHELIKRVIAISGDKICFSSNSTNTNVEIYLCANGDNYFRLLDEPYIKEKMTFSRFMVSRVPVIEYYDQDIIESIDITQPTSGGREELRQILLNSAINIPKDHFYFMGDNRNVSNDSRNSTYGARSYSCVNGKLLWILDDNSFASDLLTFLFMGFKRK